MFYVIGFVFALTAATLNASIGVLNKFAFSFGASFASVAFYKTLIGFCVLSALALIAPKIRKDIWALRKSFWKVFLLALLGVFTLYFFETWAFSIADVPMTAFMIYVPGIVTVILGVLVLNERLSLARGFALLFCMVGVAIMLLGKSEDPTVGIGTSLALLGGLGYALFIFFSRYFSLSNGLGLVWWLFMLGGLMLLGPAWYSDKLYLPIDALPAVSALAIFPTIGGFYFTLQATKRVPAGVVQIIETCDPLIASLFAYIFLGEHLTLLSTVGAAMILTSLIILSSGGSNKNETLPAQASGSSTG
ncbi:MULTISPECIES: DMT family transporter [Pseudomonas syringae group genomosp. 2]|nr:MULTISPECIES: DMT family transporter [Pseudomonas syringae group genomosp. 2]